MKLNKSNKDSIMRKYFLLVVSKILSSTSGKLARFSFTWELSGSLEYCADIVFFAAHNKDRYGRDK